jgi:predicted HNH restriction endonuclease
VFPGTPKGKKLLEDIKQCSRLCANCHTLVHAGIIKLIHP